MSTITTNNIDTVLNDLNYIESNYFTLNDIEIKRFEFNEILKLVSELTGIQQEQIKGKLKKRELVMVRYYIFTYLKNVKKHSFNDIAFFFSRNKGNIHYGYNEAKNMMQTKYKPYITVKEQIEKKLKSF